MSHGMILNVADFYWDKEKDEISIDSSIIKEKIGYEMNIENLPSFVFIKSNKGKQLVYRFGMYLDDREKRVLFYRCNEAKQEMRIYY